MPPRALPYPLFDADNHLHETEGDQAKIMGGDLARLMAV